MMINHLTSIAFMHAHNNVVNEYSCITHAVKFSHVCYCTGLFGHFKSAEITEQSLCTSQNLELLENIQQRYKHSDAVQKYVIDIILKISESK